MGHPTARQRCVPWTKRESHGHASCQGFVPWTWVGLFLGTRPASRRTAASMAVCLRVRLRICFENVYTLKQYGSNNLKPAKDLSETPKGCELPHRTCICEHPLPFLLLHCYYYYLDRSEHGAPQPTGQSAERPNRPVKARSDPTDRSERGGPSERGASQPSPHAPTRHRFTYMFASIHGYICQSICVRIRTCVCLCLRINL